MTTRSLEELTALIEYHESVGAELLSIPADEFDAADNEQLQLNAEIVDKLHTEFVLAHLAMVEEIENN